MGNRLGRAKGSRNRGYFYRAGRGWVTKIDGRFVPLEFENGQRMRDRAIPAAELKAATKRAESPSPATNGDTASATILDVCTAYLAKVQDDGAPKTFKDRAETLFDFCFGLPPRFRESEEKPKPTDRIHPGYGGKAVNELRPLDIDQWLAKHKTWKGGRRSRIQAVKRALNYGVESGLIEANPIRGYKVARQNARVTYLTPEQEAALIEAGNPAIGTAIKVCIRTGARPGCEFAKLTAKHVKDHGDRMEWTFRPSEAKTRRVRIIRVTDPDILAIVRQQVAKHPKGPLFRNTQGEPWRRENLTLSFRKLKERLIDKGMEFDKDTCMYSCRHTYAKRALQGYWTGKQINIETLARLMGNSPQVCRDHYLQWTETYNEPLWESA